MPFDDTATKFQHEARMHYRNANRCVEVLLEGVVNVR